MVKRKCTKKQLAALARGRAIRLAKLRKKTKTLYSTIPTEEKNENSEIIKVIKIGKPIEDKSYPEFLNKRKEEDKTYYPIIEYKGTKDKKQEKKEKLTIKSGLELGNYLSKKLLEGDKNNKPKIEKMLTYDKDSISKIKSEIRNWEKITNEPTKSILYNGEKIDIPISLLPEDKTFLERHGETIKNAFISALTLSVLGYGGYHGFKFFRKYCLPIIKAAASGFETVAEAGKKVYDKAGEAVSGTKNIGKSIGSTVKRAKNIPFKKLLIEARDGTRELLTRGLIKLMGGE